MEKTITIPLEEKIAVLSGMVEFTSTCEYGKSYTTVYFDKNTDEKNTYLALRDAVDTLYNTLPLAVQKPRIYSSGVDQKPVISIAVQPLQTGIDELRSGIEKNIKNKIEAIDGVAEVIIAGGHIEEIKIEFDTERLAAGGINPAALAGVIQDSNSVYPNGVLKSSSADTNVVFNTRLSSLDDIGRLPVVIAEGAVTQLSYLASVGKKPRAQEEIVRINGEESVMIHVKAASNGNSIVISRYCRSILNGASGLQMHYQILDDDGEFIAAMIRNLCIAILQTLLLVLVIVPFFYKTRRAFALISALLPVTIFWTAAFLNTLGFFLDQNVLSGISIALGLSVDSSLVLTESAEKRNTQERFLHSAVMLLPVLVAANLTTLLALVPLFFLESIVPGARSVAVSITGMVLSSLIISVLFLPCFLYKKAEKSQVLPDFLFKKIRRVYVRLSFLLSSAGGNYQAASCMLYGILICAPFVIFIIAGKNITMESRQDIMPAYIEFDADTSAAAVEKNTAEIIRRMQTLNGVSYVSTEARKGSLEISAGFHAEHTSRNALANEVDNLAQYSGDGFLYVPDAAAGKKTALLPVEIAVVGDESAICREIARAAAARIGNMPAAEQVVLNFKDPEEIIRFVPDSALIQKNALSVADIANTLRWILFGPVVDKWIQNGKEIDIRISGNQLDDATMNRIANLYIPVQGGGLRLDTLGRLEKTEGTGKIYRKDGRRAAYLTAQMRSASTDAAITAIKEVLQTIEAPKGYGFSLSRELEDMNGRYRILMLAFIGSIAGIMAVLTVMNEKPLTSLLIVSIIPVSASLPLLIRLISQTPLSMGDIVGMVVLGGIGVNNAIYIAESEKNRMRDRVRDKIQSILVSSLTTIAGSVPLFLFGAGEFSQSLAFFMLWGMVSSVAGSVVLFPAVLEKIGRHGKRLAG